MSRKTIPALALTIAALLLPAAALAITWDGTIKLGGIALDEEGDLSTVQETFDIYDGFSVGRFRLTGLSEGGGRIALDLREINLDGRQANFLWRKPGSFQLLGRLDQSRQVFDPNRAVTSERLHWGFDAKYTPHEDVTLSGSFNRLQREGDRSSFPVGSASALGNAYDNSLLTGRFGVELRRDRRGIAADLRTSNYTNEFDSRANRIGRVVSLRAHSPALFTDKLTHFVRGAFGTSELEEQGLDYRLSRFQYTGIVRPLPRFRLKYDFRAQRIDDASTELKTDRFQNGIEGAFFHSHGDLFAGYGYETNDDDRSLTSFHSWRAGGSLRYQQKITARVTYSGRAKKDEEELTLLKDTEASRLRASLDVRPAKHVEAGARLQVREREYPDIAVEAEGLTTGGHLRFEYARWVSLMADYTYTQDEYKDLDGGFDADSHVWTVRADTDRIEDLRLSAGLTYLDVGKNLDIEKTVFFAEGEYRFRPDLALEVKYNAYEYDDFVLVDRYYTANVWWVQLAYDFHRN